MKHPTCSFSNIRVPILYFTIDLATPLLCHWEEGRKNARVRFYRTWENNASTEGVEVIFLRCHRLRCVGHCVTRRNRQGGHEKMVSNRGRTQNELSETDRFLDVLEVG